MEGVLLLGQFADGEGEFTVVLELVAGFFVIVAGWIDLDVEAAYGLSMSPIQVLTKVELPMALPVIMTGIRTSLVLLVGAGAFATFIDAGGLGGLITTGITLYRNPILISGAVLIAALALAVEWVGRVLEVVFAPKGMIK